ncbi:MAG: PP2C family protein-serine/threonine phosphatase [Novosphingobium sp.]|uniref:PP2C family protein-serine/threonine phosphatase n=1 Tax=Novosphingobium sp. TaxID=1874826 RepID=UPI003B9CA3DC
MTHTGHVRAVNEDAIAVSALDEPTLVRWTGDMAVDEGWALVADGIGGHVAGEVASKIVVELLRPVMGSLTNRHEIALAVNAANDGLYATMARHPAFEGMGTTIAGVIIRGDDALAFNVGDSRIYMQTQGKLRQISEDDVVDSNMLTQCLGGFVRSTQLDPHVRKIRLPPSAKLLLCSDGLTDIIADDDIAALLALVEAEPAEILVQAALDAGGIDNVSAVVIEPLSNWKLSGNRRTKDAVARG